jgi:hypothetical protein
MGFTLSIKAIHIFSPKQISPPKDKIWNSLWNNDNPPKVNSFCWIVVHDKLLTGENILKRNIHGPFRCEMCRNAQETSQHIFLHCPYVISVWKASLQSLHRKIRWSSQPKEMLSNWKSYYRGSFKRKPLFRDLFKAFPKYICWKIWLSQNRAIFSNLHSPPYLVAKKSIALLAELFLSKSKPIPFTPSSNLESDWISTIFPFIPPIFHPPSDEILLAAS